jgi:hypothetical protein
LVLVPGGRNQHRRFAAGTLAFQRLAPAALTFVLFLLAQYPGSLLDRLVDVARQWHLSLSGQRHGQHRRDKTCTAYHLDMLR